MPNRKIPSKCYSKSIKRKKSKCFSKIMKRKKGKKNFFSK